MIGETTNIVIKGTMGIHDNAIVLGEIGSRLDAHRERIDELERKLEVRDIRLYEKLDVLQATSSANAEARAACLVRCNNNEERMRKLEDSKETFNEFRNKSIGMFLGIQACWTVVVGAVIYIIDHMQKK